MLIDYRKRIRPFLKRLNSHFKKILYIVSQVSIKVIYQFISSYVLSIQIIKFSIRKWILNLINTVDQFSNTLDHIKEKRDIKILIKFYEINPQSPLFSNRGETERRSKKMNQFKKYLFQLQFAFHHPNIRQPPKLLSPSLRFSYTTLSHNNPPRISRIPVKPSNNVGWKIRDVLLFFVTSRKVTFHGDWYHPSKRSQRVRWNEDSWSWGEGSETTGLSRPSLKPIPERPSWK